VTEAKNPLSTALGTYYPKHYVVAVIDDPAGAAGALADLRAAGFAEAVAEICPGPTFIANWRDFAANRTFLQRAADLFPAEEQAAVEEYLAEAERGASFVTVHAPGQAERDRARAILHDRGGHAMRYYGDRTITDL
jgi:hypothetical protein